jgi:hypothetical protein
MDAFKTESGDFNAQAAVAFLDGMKEQIANFDDESVEEDDSTDPLLVAFDVEKFGDGANYPITQLGACIVNMKKKQVHKRKNGELYKQSWYIRNDANLPVQKRCKEEFWDKEQNKAHFEETMAKISDPNTPAMPTVAREFIAFVVEGTEGHKWKLGTDTAGFDSAALDTIISSMKDEKHTGVNFVLGKYNSPICTDDRIKGALLTKPPVEGDLSTFEKFCIAFKVEIPTWDFKHDHNPDNDAAVIGLDYAYAMGVLSKD